MNPARDDSNSGKAADLVLAELVEGLAQRIQEGAAVDLESCIACHPEQAEALRRLWPTVAALAVAGQSAAPVELQPLSTDGPGNGNLGVLGDFRLLREVGRGGMGVVYEAEQVSMKRRVALKVLPFVAALDARQLQRFKNEAQAAGQLYHPNIVPVFVVGAERGVHYYAMQFIDGQPLSGLIRDLRQQRQEGRSPVTSGRGGMASPCEPAPTAPTQKVHATQRSRVEADLIPTLVRLGLQAAEALDYAHEHGIIHRDVKPGNLLLDVSGKLWVSDFGLARIHEEANLTRTDDLVGTLRYMNPEQVLGRRVAVDARRDVYSLGATLYELFTLEPVFDGRDRQELLHQIAHAEPLPLRRLHPALPVELETIVLKALEKEPEHRYGTAREFAEDLRRFLEHKPIRARRPTLVDRLAKWCRRHRPLMAASVLFLLLAVVGLTAGIIAIARAWDATLEREQALRRQSYPENIRQAYAAWQAGAFSRMQQLLERDQTSPTGEDLRGFEWHYLHTLLQGAPRELACVQAHEGDAYCVTWSPDGRTLVSAGMDGFVCLWDAETLQRRAAWRAHEDEVNVARFTPDGRGLVTGSDDGSVRLWDVAGHPKGKPLIGHKDWVGSLTQSPDGKSLATSGRDGVVRLWDAATGAPRGDLDLQAGWVHLVRFSPDGQILAAATARGGVILLGPGPLRRRTVANLPEEVQSVTFSPDGRTLAVGLTWPGDIRLVETATYRTVQILRGHQGTVRLASFSPDGSLLASCGDDGTVRVWGVPSGRLHQQVNEASDRVWCATWSPDGTRLATADRTGAVKVYDVSVPQARKTFPFEAPRLPGWVVFRDAARLTAGVEGNRLWELDVRSLRPKEWAPLPPCVWFPADDRSLLGLHWSACQVEVWSPDGAASWRTDCHGHVVTLERSPDGRHVVMALVPAPDCQHLAAGDAARPPTVWLWDLSSGTKHHLGRTDGDYHCVAFSPDGTCLAVGDGRCVRIVEVATGKVRQLLEGHRKNVNRFAFSPDGLLLATGSADHTVCIWDLAAGRERHRFFHPHAEVAVLRFSPDGQTLAGGDGAGQVVLWHVASGQELLTLDEHRGPVTSIAFSPDGKLLATCGLSADLNDGEVTLWNGAGRGPVQPLP